jgi:hypothetical protein
MVYKKLIEGNNRNFSNKYKNNNITNNKQYYYIEN